MLLANFNSSRSNKSNTIGGPGGGGGGYSWPGKWKGWDLDGKGSAAVGGGDEIYWKSREFKSGVGGGPVMLLANFNSSRSNKSKNIGGPGGSGGGSGGHGQAIVSRNILKTYFETGDTPTEGQFGNLIDSLVLSGSDIFRQDFGPKQSHSNTSGGGGLDWGVVREYINNGGGGGGHGGNVLKKGKHDSAMNSIRNVR